MRFEISGKTFVFVGCPEYHLRRLRVRLQELGAEEVSQVHVGVDMLVFGPAKATPTYNKAVSLGIPAVSLKRFEQGLKVGFLKVEEVMETVELEHLFGGVRAMLQESSPDESLMYRLIKKLDRCAPEQLDQLVGYIEGHVGRWTREQMHGQRGYAIYPKELKKDDFAAKLAIHRQQAGVDEELRVVPLRWFPEMSQGHSSPKYSLMRAVDFTHSSLAANAMATMLALPDMVNLHTIITSNRRAPSKTMLRMFWEHENLQGLERLVLSKFSPKLMTDAVSNSEARDLCALDLSRFMCNEGAHRTHALSLLEAPYFSTIQSICFPVSWFQGVGMGWVDVLSEPGKFSQLDTLELAPRDVSGNYYTQMMFQSKVFDGLTKIRLQPAIMRASFNMESDTWHSARHRILQADRWKGFFGCKVWHSRVHAIDVSAMSWFEGDDLEVVADLYLRPLFSGELVANAEHVYLGKMMHHPVFRGVIDALAPSHITCHDWPEAAS